MVEVKKHQRQTALFTRRLGPGLFNAIAQQQPVGQTGQGIVVGKELDVLLRRF